MALADLMKQPGMPLSAALHAAVFAAGFITFSQPKVLPDAVEAVAVEVINEALPREVTKGEQTAKQAAPTPRVDRVDPKIEQNAPGEAKRQVNNDAQPKPQEETAKEERKETTAVVIPPKAVIIPPKPVDPPKPVEPPKPAVAKPPKAAEAVEEEEAEEVIRQAARKKLEQQKADEQRKAEERKKAEDQRKVEEAKRQEDQRRQQEEARKREEQKKLADAKAAEAKAAEEKKKAEDAKRVQEAAKKAAEEKKKREAEQAARNQQAIDNARRVLEASREPAQNAGNTGQQVSRTPAAGAATATGQRLNPSDRAALAGLLADQIRSCWSVPVSGKPGTLPLVRISLGADGSLQGAPTLTNSSGDPNFRAVAESGMRAIRQCAPFRIPSRFAATYNDWRSTIVQLNPED